MTGADRSAADYNVSLDGDNATQDQGHLLARWKAQSKKAK